MSLVGNTAVPKQTTAPVVTTVSIDKLLVSESDFIHKLTGINQTGISGSFQYGDRYMFFNNAVIDGYSVNASIGELPTISFDMSIYGDFSGGSFSIDGTGSSPKAVAQSDATVRPTLNSGIIFQYADFGRSQDAQLQTITLNLLHTVKCIIGFQLTVFQKTALIIDQLV